MKTLPKLEASTFRNYFTKSLHPHDGILPKFQGKECLLKKVKFMQHRLWLPV